MGKIGFRNEHIILNINKIYNLYINCINKYKMIYIKRYQSIPYINTSFKIGLLFPNSRDG